MKDLVVIVADGTIQKVLEELLRRVAVSSNTNNFTFDVISNIGHDAGCYNDSHEILINFVNQYFYAMVVFDKEGSGVEEKPRTTIEEDVESLLDKNGWAGRNSVIVIDPELENWIWQNSPHVENAFGWNSTDNLYAWCYGHGIIAQGESKPFRPKESLQRILKETKTPFSSSIHKKIAEKVSYKNCQDPAFVKLTKTLYEWFKKS
ncbi:MAG: hypothetical protein HYX40_00950 [Sphingobacteriales bacterium]|nr:hypothetical protein [Sphingobacteriales bacterium]